MPTMSLPHRVVEISPARRDTHNHLDLYWWKQHLRLARGRCDRCRRVIEEHKARVEPRDMLDVTVASTLMSWTAFRRRALREKTGGTH
jgi:hypothetical protein